MVKLATANIVGSASSTTWSQAQSFSHDDTQLMVVVELSCDDSESIIDLATVGALIIEEIEKAGQGRTKLDDLIKLSKLAKDNVKEGLQLEILIASLNQETLSIYGQGRVEAFLAREDKLARLKNEWGEGDSVSGVLKMNDVLVLSTTRFVDMVGIEKFREIVTHDSEPAELLAPLIHTQSETSGVAAVVGVMAPVKSELKWPQIHLRSTEPKKLNMWVAGVILILLVLMIGIGMVRRVKVEAEREYMNLSTSVVSKIDETLSIGDLNPERARILLKQASEEVKTYLVSEKSSEYKTKAENLLKEIEKADETAFKKNEINLTTVAELSILSEGLEATNMKTDGKGNLVFLDTASPRMVLMNLTDRSRQVRETTNAEKLVDLGVSESKVYGLSNTGVTEFFWKKDDSKKMIEADEFWKNPARIAIFAGNAYVLDKEQGEIWKYPTLGDTFGGRRRWFAVGIAPDLSNVVDMKVVGDVWLLTSSGKLERYSRGAPVTFAMEGFPAKNEAKKLSEPSAIWVSDSNVYVLENGAERVVVFSSEGKYESQYVSSEFGKASDLVVVDDKAYVLIDNVVKEFGL